MGIENEYKSDQVKEFLFLLNYLSAVLSYSETGTTTTARPAEADSLVYIPASITSLFITYSCSCYHLATPGIRLTRTAWLTFFIE